MLRGLALFTCRLLAYESLLCGFGVMLLSRPDVLLAMMAFGFFFLTWEALTRDGTRDAFSWLYARSIPLRFRGKWWGSYDTSAVVFPAVVTLVFSFATWGWATDKLCSTGQFGECPNNRHVVIHKYPDGGMLFEFRVRYAKLRSTNVGIWFDPPVYTAGRAKRGFGKPGATIMPEELTGPAGFTETPNAPGVWGVKQSTWGVTQERSYYVMLNPERSARIHCYFRTYDETEGHVCREDVAITEVDVPVR